MKRNFRLFAAVAILFFPILVSAQTERGTQLVGANVNLDSKNIDTGAVRNLGSSTYNLNLRYGRFFANNFAAGVALPLTFSKIDQQSNLSWGAGPFIRYYSPFEDEEGSGSKLFLLLEARATYNQNTFEDKALKLKRETSYFGAGGGFGIIYFVNESVGIESLLDYNYLASLNNSNKSAGFSLNIGFQIYLNRYGF
ncbi:MAG: hypothetical protein K1X81_08315 [Bacteroidia bacterium]|nr:hypothetical protein [Bacteroidia bacterium]